MDEQRSRAGIATYHHWFDGGLARVQFQLMQPAQEAGFLLPSLGIIAPGKETAMTFYRRTQVIEAADKANGGA